ncbi:TerC family protein [bacterium CPR1]|nr:TerC family protein [bacterium CPR1]
MEWITDSEIWISLITLTLLEIVLGIDNIIFLSILSGRLPVEQQRPARRIGLGLAVFTRCLLLLSLNWVANLTTPWFTIAKLSISGRDFILIVGGLFLLFKSTHEIHLRLEGEEEEQGEVKPAGRNQFVLVLVQILLLDIVFSLDSVITAVGMASKVQVMIAAVIIAIGIMMIAADAIADFVNRHPTIKMLALSFLLLIGMSLVAEGFDHHIPKGYIYFSMAFSAMVEALNLRTRSKRRPTTMPVSDQ